MNYCIITSLICHYMYTQKMKRSLGKGHTQTHRSLNEKCQWSQDVFLDQKRVNICEHTVKMVSHQSFVHDAIFSVSSHTLFWLRKTSVIIETFEKLLCVYVCLSPGYLFIFLVRVSSFFPIFFVLSILRYFPFHMVSLYVLFFKMSVVSIMIFTTNKYWLINWHFLWVLYVLKYISSSMLYSLVLVRVWRRLQVLNLCDDMNIQSQRPWYSIMILLTIHMKSHMTRWTNEKHASAPL